MNLHQESNLANVRIWLFFQNLLLHVLRVGVTGKWLHNQYGEEWDRKRPSSKPSLPPSIGEYCIVGLSGCFQKKDQSSQEEEE